MTNHCHDHPDDAHRVVSLDCARAEDALAEGGPLDAQTTLHLRSCESCQELAELIGCDGAIARATAPAPLPVGFADAVLDRALAETHPLDRIRPATDDLRVAELEAALETRRRRTTWIAAAALVAGLLVAAGAYNVWGPKADAPDHPTPAAQPVAKAPTAAPKASTRVATEAPRPQAPAPRVAETKPAAAFSPLATAPPTPRTPEAIPEPIVDIPAEIRASVLRTIRQAATCPKHNRTPVRLTLTVTTAGSIASPQLLSASGNAKAHQCVSWAVDRLLLPPQPQAVTVTLDLSW